jgi:hypothetical protein
MSEPQDPDGTEQPPLLTEPVEPTGEVPVLTDAVAESPASLAAAGPGHAPVSPATIAALREALTVAAADLGRACVDEVVEEARASLERRLTVRFEEELGALIERTLRAHLETGD